MRAWFGDFDIPRTLPGTCRPTAPGSGLTLTGVACKGYVRLTDGSLQYVDQSAVSVALTASGLGYYWLAIHRDVSTPLSGWTRQAGTHYVWQFNATGTSPANPPEGLLFAKVATDGTRITGIQYLNGGSSTIHDAITGGSGTSTDPWTGWDNAISWTNDTCYVFDRPGYYLQTHPITISGNFICVIGFGARTTHILYQPTADNTTAWTIGGTNTGTLTGSQGNYGLFEGLSLEGDSSAFKKTMLRLLDVASYHVHDVFITVSDPGCNSVGLYSQGRNQSVISFVTVIAPYARIIGRNVNTSDHFQDWDLNVEENVSYFGTGTCTHPSVTAEPAVVINQTRFVNLNLEAAGGGMAITDTTSILNYVLIDGVRCEQFTGAAPVTGAYCLNLQAQSLTLEVRNLQCCIGQTGANGYKFRNAKPLSLSNVSFDGGGGGVVALDVDTTSNNITLRNLKISDGSCLTGNLSLVLQPGWTSTFTNAVGCGLPSLALVVLDDLTGTYPGSGYPPNNLTIRRQSNDPNDATTLAFQFSDHRTLPALGGQIDVVTESGGGHTFVFSTSDSSSLTSPVSANRMAINEIGPSIPTGHVLTVKDQDYSSAPAGQTQRLACWTRGGVLVSCGDSFAPPASGNLFVCVNTSGAVFTQPTACN